MVINPSKFHVFNVVDMCAAWNVLSSLLLYSRARSAGCTFCVTHFVLYECLYKRRKSHSKEDAILKERLNREYIGKVWQAYHLDIEDLQDIGILENRKKLSKGELASIAFAKKTSQAFLTDDQKARKLAEVVLEKTLVQTTPHLLGWLCFTDSLGDWEKDQVIIEHRNLGRPLAQYFEEIFAEALRCRSMNGLAGNLNGV